MLAPDKLSGIKAKCAAYRAAQRKFQYCVTRELTSNIVCALTLAIGGNGPWK